MNRIEEREKIIERYNDLLNEADSVHYGHVDKTISAIIGLPLIIELMSDINFVLKDVRDLLIEIRND